jgi:hypothetical protein
MAIYSTNRMEHISAWCGQNAGFLMVDLAVHLHTNNRSLKGLKIFFVSLHICVYVHECVCVYSCVYVWPMHPLKYFSSPDFP